MTSRILITLAGLSIAAFACPSPAAAASLPREIKAGEHELKLNGWGARSKYFVEMYVSGLYLAEQSGQGDAIITSDAPMAIRIEITSRFVSQKKLVASLNEGFEKATGGNLRPIQREIARFRQCFSDPIQRGDVFDLVHFPSKGVAVFKNGKLKGIVSGKAFKEALFGIWLSDDPVDETLKRRMLGDNA